MPRSIYDMLDTKASMKTLLLILLCGISWCSDAAPIEAYMSVDIPLYDKDGKHAGWNMLFSAHIGPNGVRYWVKEGEPIDYKIPPHKTTAVRSDIQALAIEIFQNKAVTETKENRIQFGFTNQSGSLSGLYFWLFAEISG